MGEVGECLWSLREVYGNSGETVGCGSLLMIYEVHSNVIRYNVTFNESRKNICR